MIYKLLGTLHKINQSTLRMLYSQEHIPPTIKDSMFFHSKKRSYWKSLCV
jgi:hypothetical protein